MSPDKRLEIAMAEYNTLSQHMMEIYRGYYRLLYFAIVAMGAITVVLMNHWSKGQLHIAFFSIIFLFVVNTWVAGWAYVNLELWSHRKYLAILEKNVRTLAGIEEEDKAPFCFYRRGLLEMYSTCVEAVLPGRMRRLAEPGGMLGKLGNPVKGHVVLDVVFVGSIGLCYAVTVAYVCFIGVPALVRHLFGGPGPLAVLFSATGSLALVALSVWFLVLTVRAKQRIETAQRERIDDGIWTCGAEDSGE